jgi:hypothetical protein
LTQIVAKVWVARTFSVSWSAIVMPQSSVESCRIDRFLSLTTELWCFMPKSLRICFLLAGTADEYTQEPPTLRSLSTHAITQCAVARYIDKLYCGSVNDQLYLLYTGPCSIHLIGRLLWAETQPPTPAHSRITVFGIVDRDVIVSLVILIASSIWHRSRS